MNLKTYILILLSLTCTVVSIVVIEIYNDPKQEVVVPLLRVESLDKSYSIKFPGYHRQACMARDVMDKYCLLKGQIITNVLFGESLGIAYSVEHCLISKERLTTCTTDELLKKGVLALLESSGTELISKDDIELNGYPGKRVSYKCTESKEPKICRVELFVIKPYVYIITIYKPENVIYVNEDEFFNSFNFTGNATRSVINNNHDCDSIF